MTSYYKAVKLYADPGMGKKEAKKKAVVSSDGYQQPAKNSELYQYFDLQRKENKAALRLQTFWRKIRRIRTWRKAVHAMFCVVKIQKIIRGWVARKYVARWFIVRNRTAVIWQSTFRKYVVNLHLRPRIAHERKMVIKIQACVRRMIATIRVRQMLLNLAATRIQALWRGVVDRAFADRMWLDQKVIPIQKAARRMVAKKQFTGQYKLLNQAALLIQRKFRTTLASRKVGEILHEREMSYRMSLIRMLTTEEEYYLQRISRLMNRVIANEVREKAEQALVDVQQSEKFIYEKELEYVDIRRQAEITSPRAIEQGFRDQLLANAATVRKEITSLKYTHLFNLYTTHNDCDENFEQAVFEIEELAAGRARVSKWREQEYEDRRHLNFHREQTEKRRLLRLAVAEERRKWQVRYYTKSGKPDKRRRPGRPWDPSVYAGPEKSTYSGAVGVDLLAFVKSKQGQQNSSADGKTDVKTSVDNAVNQVTLQTYLDQVNTYQQLLNPLFLILQQHVGLLPKDPMDTTVAPDAGMNGFGEEGQKFKEAISNLDVPAPGRTRIKTRGKNEFKTYVFSDSSRLNTANTAPIADLDRALGFVPPGSRTNTSASIASSVMSPPDTRSSIRSSQKRSDQESIDDLSFSGISKDNNDIYTKRSSSSGLPKEGSIETLETHPSEALDEDIFSYNDDDSDLKPAMEGIFMPSKRYWKKPPKKYLPAEDAFSLPKSTNVSKTKEISTSIVAQQFPPRLSSFNSKSMTSLPPSNPTRNISAVQVMALEMASKVAEREAAESKALEETKIKNKGERARQAERRKERKATRRRTGAIPWDLLDEIEGSRARLESEIAFVEFHHKI